MDRVVAVEAFGSQPRQHAGGRKLVAHGHLILDDDMHAACRRSLGSTARTRR